MAHTYDLPPCPGKLRRICRPLGTTFRIGCTSSEPSISTLYGMGVPVPAFQKKSDVTTPVVSMS